MPNIAASSLFKQQITHRLTEALDSGPEFRNAGVFPTELLSLSTNPDFGDYFSTIAIHIGEATKSDPAHVATTLAERMRLPNNVLRLEPTGCGFINFFVKPAAAGVALWNLSQWLEEHLPSNSMPGDAQHWLLVKCRDTKLHFAFHVWRRLAEFDIRSAYFSTKLLAQLADLTEPEEFSVCLLLHEFPEKLLRKVPSGYLYQLAVRVRDGFFWRDQVAPFWIEDWEAPSMIPARHFLLALCERVLRAGITNIFHHQTGR